MGIETLCRSRPPACHLAKNQKGDFQTSSVTDRGSLSILNDISGQNGREILNHLLPLYKHVGNSKIMLQASGLHVNLKAELAGCQS